jgi:hypothetical protein
MMGMSNSIGKWFAGTSEDSFLQDEEFETREQAIAEGPRIATEYEGGELTHFYVAQAQALTWRTNRHAEYLLESVEERTFEEWEDAPDIRCGKEAMKELDDEIKGVLDRWIAKHGLAITYWVYENVERIDCVSTEAL